jgi:hypothetical protein
MSLRADRRPAVIVGGTVRIPYHNKGQRMKKTPKAKREPDLLDEYDFGKGVRGKYASRGGTAMVITIESDLEAVLKEQARAQGISPEELAVKTLRERLLSRPQLPEPRDD